MASLLSSHASVIPALAADSLTAYSTPHTGVIVDGDLALTSPVHASGLGWAQDNCIALSATSMAIGATFHIRKDPAAVPANTFLPVGEDDIVAVVWEFDGDADDRFYDMSNIFAIGDAGAFGSNGATTSNHLRIREKRPIECQVMRVDEDFTTVSSPGPTYTGVLDRVDARMQAGAGWGAGGFSGVRYLGAYSQWQRNKLVMMHILDDGSQDQFDYWWPIFRDREIPFTMALNSSQVGVTGVSLDNLFLMKDSGLVDFVNHGRTHMVHADEPDAQVAADDMDDGYNELVAFGLIDHKAKVYVHTTGAYGQRELDHLNAENYHMAFGTRSDDQGGNNEFDFLGLGGVPLNPMEMMRGLHFSHTAGEATAASCLALIDRGIDVGSMLLCGYGHVFPEVPVASTDFQRDQIEPYADGLVTRRDAGKIDFYGVNELAAITQDFGLFSGGLNAMRRRRR